MFVIWSLLFYRLGNEPKKLKPPPGIGGDDPKLELVEERGNEREERGNRERERIRYMYLVVKKRRRKRELERE